MTRYQYRLRDSNSLQGNRNGEGTYTSLSSINRSIANQYYYRGSYPANLPDNIGHIYKYCRYEVIEIDYDTRKLEVRHPEYKAPQLYKGVANTGFYNSGLLPYCHVVKTDKGTQAFCVIKSGSDLNLYNLTSGKDGYKIHKSVDLRFYNDQLKNIFETK